MTFDQAETIVDVLRRDLATAVLLVSDWGRRVPQATKGQIEGQMAP